MKTIYISLIALLVSTLIFAQVGIGTVNPHTSSLLHLESSTAGLLIPRLTNSQKILIPSPATGLLIYQTGLNNGFWYYNGSAWVPIAKTYTFNNGITESNNNAQLGGSLVKQTTIDLGNFDFKIQTSSLSNFTGDFEIVGRDRNILKTSIPENYVHFGNNFPFLGTSVDGTTLTTIGGDTYVVDVLAGFQSGNQIGGSSIKMGSIEYFIDGVDEIYLDANAGFHPRDDQSSSFGASLGNSSKRWARVYANDGIIQTSDMRFKTNIKPLQYGLKEILKLKTFTYNWKEDSVGNRLLLLDEIEKKIGISAQDLLDIIPEVVSTHSWVASDEEGNYKYVKNDKLGVNYAELIPVLIKAIQEQQEQIEELKKKIKSY